MQPALRPGTTGKLSLPLLAAIFAVALAGTCLLVPPGTATAAAFAKPAKFNGGVLVLVDPIRLGRTSVSVSTDWERKRAFVRVGVKTPEGAVQYATRISKPRYGKIAAKHASLGKTSLKFKPVSQQKVKVKVNHNRCAKKKKAKGFVQGGFLRGKVKFKGEKGYLNLNKKLKGKKAKTWANRLLLKLPKCALKPERPVIPKLKGKGAYLVVASDNVFFHMVGGNRANNRLGAELRAFNTKGKTSIYRDASIVKNRVTFNIDNYPELDIARVGAHVGQLKGTAVFNRATDGTYTVGGNLKANFPGRTNVSLTSSKVDATLELFGFKTTASGVAGAGLAVMAVSPFTPAGAILRQPGSPAGFVDAPTLAMPGS